MKLKEVSDEKETIIYRYTVEQLIQKFIRELEQKSLICYRESLHDILQQLDLKTDSLSFTDKAPFSTSELEHISLTLMRFDLLFRSPEQVLSKLVGRQLDLHSANIAEKKWYRETYREFNSALRVPESLLRDLYATGKDLLDLFYPEGSQERFRLACERFGVQGSAP